MLRCRRSAVLGGYVSLAMKHGDDSDIPSLVTVLSQVRSRSSFGYCVLFVCWKTLFFASLSLFSLAFIFVCFSDSRCVGCYLPFLLSFLFLLCNFSY